MSQALIITKNQFDSLQRRIEKLEQIVKSLLTGEDATQAPYGSEAWWTKEEKEADDDIKAGRIHGPFQTKEELQTFLDSLK